MTSARRHSRAPLRRSSAPERILSAGLATATCVGIVGLVGARTIEANAESADQEQEQVALTQAAATLPSEAGDTTAPVPAEPTTSSGLTQADLDDYSAQLAAERDRLDAYRAKLVKTAKRLQRQAARQAAAASTVTTWVPSTTSSRNSTSTSSSSRPSKPAKSTKASTQPQAPAPEQQAPAPPQQSKPAPQPAAAPAAKAAPQQQAPAPQSNTKSS